VRWLTILENLSKPRRQRQRERHQTKSLISRTMAVRYTEIFAVFAQQQREMTKVLHILEKTNDSGKFLVFSFGIDHWCH